MVTPAMERTGEMSRFDRRASVQSENSESAVIFPEFDPSIDREHDVIYEEQAFGRANGRRLSSSPVRRSNGALHSEKWNPRKDFNYTRSNGHMNGTTTGRNRQKSLSEAIRTIHARRGSVSANAVEIAEALKAPVSFKLVILCLIWYFSSALTNTSSKSILTTFRKPVTLTIVQFLFVSFWCLFFARLAIWFPGLKTAIPALKNGIRPPTRDVIMTALPLALFQVGGHILSSQATALIPVSLVHTIKGLSPLFTVAAYRLIFNIHYTMSTYLSLIPLTIGVVLACSVQFSGNVIGIICAFVAALIFVSQNIFSKKLFNEAARVEADSHAQDQSRSKKLDKLNLLCYCSSLAFILTLPLWLWSEGFPLLVDFYSDGSITLSNRPNALDHGRLTLEFFFNGIFHFGQNIIAFVLLSMVSPVTYSVASLIKRVFVIIIAIIWFRQPTTGVQALGIALTFLGLYLYDRTHDSARAAKHLHRPQGQPLLPLTSPMPHENGVSIPPFSKGPNHPAYIFPPMDNKKSDASGPGRPRSGSRGQGWLPPGTKQEETWQLQDMKTQL